MEFWFCEKCGVRVTEKELAAGASRNADTGVVFCTKCTPATTPAPAAPEPIPIAAAKSHSAPSSGSMPKTRATPVTGSASSNPVSGRALPSRATGIRVRETTILRAPPKRETSSGRPLPGDRGQHPAPADAGSRKNLPLILGASSVAVFAIVVVFTMTGSPAKPPAATGTSTGAAATTTAVARQDTPSPPTSSTASSRGSDTVPAPPITAAQTTSAPALSPREVLNEESKAQDAFSALEKNLRKLSDADSQISAVDAFLKTYGETIVGSRARALRSKLKSGEPFGAAAPPVAAASATPPAPPANAAAANPAAPTVEDNMQIVNRAEALSARQDFAGAIAEYDKAIKIDDRQYVFFQNRANAKLGVGDMDGVMADTEKAIALQPTSWGAWVMRAIAAYGLRRQDEYQVALEKSATLSGVPLKDMEQKMTADVQRARWIVDGRAFESKPPAAGDDFRARGMYRIISGKLVEGAADLREALKRDPTLGPKGLFSDITNLARMRKDFKEVMAYMKQWADLKPEDARAMNGFAWELLTCEDVSLRDPKLALTYSERANELTQKKDPAILDTLALAYFNNNRVRTAIATEQKAISLLTAETPPDVRKDFEKHLAEFQVVEGKESN